MPKETVTPEVEAEAEFVPETDNPEEPETEEKPEAPLKETEKEPVEDDYDPSEYLPTVEPKKETVDYEARWKGSQKEYEKKWKPMEEAMGKLDAILARNPKLAAALEAEARQEASPETIATNLESRFDQLEKAVVGIAEEDQTKQRQEREKSARAFHQNFGKHLTKTQRAELAKDVEALTKAGRPYEESLMKAYYLQKPEALIEKGKNEAYLNQAKVQLGSFTSQTSDLPAKKEAGKTYTPAELAHAKKLDPSGQLYRQMTGQK